MNRRRTLIRLWMIGSVLWIGYAGWLVMGSRSTFPDPNLLVTGTVTLGPPIGIFALGSVVARAKERLRNR